MKQHPKASAINFWNDDYKETCREEKDGLLIVHEENSASREKVTYTNLPGEKHYFAITYPGGGCNYVNGMLVCSIVHIDWQIPPKKEN